MTKVNPKYKEFEIFTKLPGPQTKKVRIKKTPHGIYDYDYEQLLGDLLSTCQLRYIIYVSLLYIWLYHSGIYYLRVNYYILSTCHYYIYDYITLGKNIASSMKWLHHLTMGKNMASSIYETISNYYSSIQNMAKLFPYSLAPLPSILSSSLSPPPKRCDNSYIFFYFLILFLLVPVIHRINFLLSMQGTNLAAFNR